MLYFFDCRRSVIHPIKLISKLTENDSRFSRVKQTTQFIVGASNETDKEIVKYSWGLYKRLKLSRVYFSAYQRGNGEPALPGENSPRTNNDLLVREHRLYQVDWLMRKYGFNESEIPFGPDDNLSLESDPKEAWAKAHPEYFPVNVNKASRDELLRIPGLGAVAVGHIIANRESGGAISSISQLGKPGKRLAKASAYITF